MLPRALTIAGSDSGGGAGIQADLKTFTVLGVYGMTAITCVTVQNTVGVFGVVEIPPEVVYQQIKVVAEDIGVDALKTGMLYSQQTVEAVAKAVKELKLNNLVVDPVMRAKSGDPLLKPEAVEALVEHLIPLATLITPNIPEAEDLTGMRIRSVEDMEKACLRLMEYGCKAVLLKGGHMEGDKVTDVFYDGKSFEYIQHEKVTTKNTHGTGCTLSAAITAFLAKGLPLEKAVRMGVSYLLRAISTAPSLGKGHGPLNHMWPLPSLTEPQLPNNPFHEI
ncbi:phosphomethylpyrimidine kinase [Thermocrinis albus DSM 14484]|uniref:hydroxymethylpyrimidine kinase n=1 Tax=Thermocrinis albus (strain DSM 14484 / JCM 11386 / HI 11/12) TaxID=638303 RepID=D3SNZ5_THEAH|nr:bifunctional hydroxymethylpyrimidine kinase/phosphomethylpyrimidine kinase [Thermocrinis albus]ADC88882.1 phosphomethylpyrimidine kinase [Thermocrinis albus DSM 14484]